MKGIAANEFLVAVGHVVSMPVRCGRARHDVDFELTATGSATLRNSPCLYLPDFLRPQQGDSQPGCLAAAGQIERVVPLIAAAAELNLPAAPDDDAHPAIRAYNELRQLPGSPHHHVRISGPRVDEAKAELIARLLNANELVERWPRMERLGRERLLQLAACSPASLLVAVASLEDTTLAASLARDARMVGIAILDGLRSVAEAGPLPLVDCAAARLWPQLHAMIEAAEVLQLNHWALSLAGQPDFWCALIAAACVTRAAELSGTRDPADTVVAQQAIEAIERQFTNPDAQEQLVQSIRTQFLAGHGAPLARDAERSDWVRRGLVWLVRRLVAHVQPTHRATLELVLALYS